MLIFDEAISNLDQQTAERFAQTVNRLNDLYHAPGAQGLTGG
ncbi:MAG TPA: hypothetical protein VNO84_13935 [Burkholderiaceae bacterium]|nr:hypothetical protein [Burkholderiaceae bacterium]